jgi:hypothetical protein
MIPSSIEYASGVPHVEQNQRERPGEDAYRASGAGGVRLGSNNSAAGLHVVDSADVSPLLSTTACTVRVSVMR